MVAGLGAAGLFAGAVSCGADVFQWWSDSGKTDVEGLTAAPSFKVLTAKPPPMLNEDGAVFYNEGPARLQLELDKEIQKNTNLQFQVKFCAKNRTANKVIFRTGADKEEVALNLNPNDGGFFQCTASSPSSTRKPLLIPLIRNGGIAKRSFSWDDTLLLWSDIYSKKSKRDLSEDWVNVSFEFRADTVRFLLDGVLLSEWAPVDGMWGRKMSVDIPQGLRIRLAAPAASVDDPLYSTVDISNRLNARGINEESVDPASMPERGRKVMVKGIPFVLPLLPKSGDDHIDAKVSWFREGNLAGYEEPHNGSFGGRWTGALKNDPTRIQFRIPYRQYNAIYLIAAGDDDENALPELTAQFYRPGSGFPKSFKSEYVGSFRKADGSDSSRLPVRNSDGKTRYLHLVRIPVDPASLQEFSDLSIIELELTKRTQTYRAYPDPNHFSEHAAGLPSSVQVFAMTLGTAPVSVEFNPDSYANIWTEPAQVSYTTKATNNTSAKKEVTLSFNAVSYDGQDKHAESKRVTLAPGASGEVKFAFAPKKFGHYEVSLKSDDGQAQYAYPRTLAYLRKREHKARDFNSKGFMFGFWNWAGAHVTPDFEQSLKIMGPAGVEAIGTGVKDQKWASPDTLSLMEKYEIKSYLAFGSSDLWAVSYLVKNLPDDDKKAVEQVMASYKKGIHEKSTVSDPLLVRVFAEPGGLGTHGALPEFYGEPEHQFDEKQQKLFDSQHRRVGIAAEAAKTLNPDVKILMPHGDPCYAIPFLKKNDDKTKSLDGVAVDIGFFERLPEQQIHQCSLHRMMMLNHYWKKIKGTEPLHVTFEGPCIGPVTNGALSERQYASYLVRSCMIMGAYGVKRQFTSAAPADCAGWWGEQHYGGGLLSRINGLNPHEAYSTFAAMTRHLTDAEFAGWVPTGSLSTYCLKFRKNDGRYMYAVWTIRGRRSIVFDSKDKLEVYDAMDNSRFLKSENGKVSVDISDMPVYVYGLGEKPVAALGESDHTDSNPGDCVKQLGNTADLFVRQSQDADTEYVDSFPEAIRRFPSEMKLATVAAPKEFGSKALAVKLLPQSKDRGIMPFYTALHPEKPIEIPGKGKYISVWVKGASDWGRIVYVMRDAKGEKWVSVGSKGEWNSDDQPNASYFNFDGWRLVRFELPSHSPYDNYREMGTTWWGASGGDNVVDLPLSLEKVFIERRPKAMYVNSLEACSDAPVELGNIMVEYENAFDMGAGAVELSKVRIPVPQNVEQNNPIAELAATGTLPAGKITSVEQPGSMQDGTRGIFSFEEMPDAERYDIYLSMHQDGRGAIKLGNGLKKSGVQVAGFRANTDFYAFVVYYDKKGNASKPSEAFKFKLENIFGMK